MALDGAMAALGVLFLLAPYPGVRLRWRLLHFVLVLGLIDAALLLSRGPGIAFSVLLLLVAVFQAFFVIGRRGGYIAALVVLLTVLAYQPMLWEASGSSLRVLVVSDLFFAGGLGLAVGVSLLVLSERRWRREAALVQDQLAEAYRQVQVCERVAADLAQREAVAEERARAARGAQDRLVRYLEMVQVHLDAGRAEPGVPERALHALGLAAELVGEALSAHHADDGAGPTLVGQAATLAEALADLMMRSQPGNMPFGVPMCFTTEGDPWPCPPEYERLLYDAAATELAALWQRPSIREVAMTLTYALEQVQLSIREDGSVPFAGATDRYMALTERVALLNGVCRLSRTTAGRCELRVCLPRLRRLPPVDEESVTLVRESGS